MKRWLTMALVVFAISLTGCKKQPKIGMCVRQMDAGLTAWQASKLEDHLVSAGYGVETVDAYNSQAKQVEQISRLIDQKVDLLIVEPVITAEMSRIAEIVGKADVPLIFLNYVMNEKDAAQQAALCSIATDESLVAAIQWQVFTQLPVSADRNEDGNLGYCRIGVGKEYLDANIWEGGCKRFFLQPPLGVQWGQWNVESGRRIAAQQLSGFENKLDVIFCGCDALTLGAQESLRGTNCCLIGTGANQEILQGIRQGSITATVCPDIYAIAETVVRVTGRLFRDQPVEKTLVLPPMAVTKDNLEKMVL